MIWGGNLSTYPMQRHKYAVYLQCRCQSLDVYPQYWKVSELQNVCLPSHYLHSLGKSNLICEDAAVLPKCFLVDIVGLKANRDVGDRRQWVHGLMN